MGNHNEITRDYYNDIRDKKRTGANIHNRKATRKGARWAALRTPYYYMNTNDRKTLNGKLNVFNMYDDIIDMDELLSQYSPDSQKRIIQKWRTVHSEEDIIAGLNTDPQNYYDLLEEFKMSVETNSQSLEEMKSSLIPLETFNKLSDEEKAELIFHYGSHYSSKEIIEKMGFPNKQAYYNTRYRLRKLNTSEDTSTKKPKKPAENEDTLTSQALDYYKRNIAPRGIFKDLSKKERAILLFTYLHNYKTSTIAEEMGVKKSTLYNYTGKLKEFLPKDFEPETLSEIPSENVVVPTPIEEQETESTTAEAQPVNQKEEERTEEQKTEPVPQEQPKEVVATQQEMFQEDEVPHEQKESSPVVQDAVQQASSENQETPPSFFFTINQKGDASSIEKKIGMLIACMDENDEYEVSITIKQS
ncbi:hypothetical protein IMZ31_21820 (plasmid) [Pontibacillus sp. ALD_SL1]|uniref:sigma-70 region 4 domain-containing protein n=1 Tax=Pontibacillus sp. ALD_SL1 TaxID=2777185 RepID=UPI001A958BB9|nr:sigma-70 region 4 domain-containing protein [Pontibacillus sp. ALD_SL1]QST02091.1 hypothetical protein IMZ31_21820 [Pontibacillus sp. ALD_SL1]